MKGSLEDRIKNSNLNKMELISFEDEKEWLKIRNTGIGGSDVGTILGYNKYKDPYTLFLEKTGKITPVDISKKEAVLRGKEAEKHLIGLCNVYNKNSNFFTPEVTFRRLDKPFMLANLDGISEDLTEGLEIKTARVFDMKDWKGRIPDNYYCQILWYMAVTGLEKFKIFASVEKVNYSQEVERRELIEYTIYRKQEEIDFLEKEVEKFWNKVQKKEWKEFNMSFEI